MKWGLCRFLAQSRIYKPAEGYDLISEASVDSCYSAHAAGPGQQTDADDGSYWPIQPFSYPIRGHKRAESRSVLRK